MHDFATLAHVESALTTTPTGPLALTERESREEKEVGNARLGRRRYLFMC